MINPYSATNRCYSGIYYLRIALLCIVSCLFTTQNNVYGYYGYMSTTPRPPIEEQRELAIEIITDTLLDPSLDAIAVVQSPVDAHARVGRSDLGVGSLHDYMRAFNFDCVFVAETLYGENILPAQINIIQEKMYSSHRWRYHPPRNYRDRLFHYDDSVWLVFLKRDHVMNYRRSSSNSHHTEIFINEALDNDLSKDEALQVLNLDHILAEGSMFSLVEDFASFLIDVPGPKLVPIYRERKRIMFPMLHVPDPDKEYVLPPEFLDDLSDILRALTDHDARRAMRAEELRTDPGRAIARRVFDRADKKGVNHLSRGWVRRYKTPSPSPERMDVVFDLRGTVRNEDGDPVPDAEVWVAERTDPGVVKKCITNAAGELSMSAERAISENLRILVLSARYASSAFSLKRDELEITLKQGVPVRFDMEIEDKEGNQFDLKDGALYIIDSEYRVIIAAVGVRDIGADFPQWLWHHNSHYVRMLPKKYDLIWMLKEKGGDTGIYLGRRFIGDSEVERVVIETPSDIQLLDSNQILEFLVFE